MRTIQTQKNRRKDTKDRENEGVFSVFFHGIGNSSGIQSYETYASCGDAQFAERNSIIYKGEGS